VKVYYADTMWLAGKRAIAMHTHMNEPNLPEDSPFCCGCCIMLSFLASIRSCCKSFYVVLYKRIKGNHLRPIKRDEILSVIHVKTMKTYYKQFVKIHLCGLIPSFGCAKHHELECATCNTVRIQDVWT
jgi:hypothetical protein